MSSSLRTYVVSFDVADDRRRVRLSKFLESRGQRVQWSVFEILATPEGLCELIERAMIPIRFDPAADSLRCYPLCGVCREGIEVRGMASPPVTPGRPIVL